MSSMVTTRPLEDALQRALRVMDAEATTRYPDLKVQGAAWSAGLRQYHQHFNALHGSRLGCEPSWSRRLAELLNRDGIRAEAEVGFPHSALPPGKTRQSCDLRVHMDGGPAWIEVKGSWPVCFNALHGGGVEDYVWGTYRKHLHTTGEDFAKLERLRHPDAVRLGVLLVGFDTGRERLDGEVGKMVRRVGAGWSGGELTSWDEPHYGTKARIWYWTKTAVSV